MEHKNSTILKNKTLSRQNKHDMAEENSTKKYWGKRPNPENRYNLI
jgi:hypothetical protein